MLPLLLTLSYLGDGPPLKRFEFTEPHMGTRFRIVLYTSDEALARRASRAAFDRIAQLDAVLSDYNPESELMRLCAQAGGPPVPVGDDLFAVLEKSLEFSRQSAGAFDITIAPVGRLWRRARRTRKLPDPKDLARTRALVGFQNIKLDAKARTVQLLKPAMKLDLGAIAKGYASGEAIATLKRLGIERALVAGSGDIVVGEPPPGAEGWTIAVAPLESPGAPANQFVALRNAAVSTSGDAEQFVEIDGRRYSHILDPKTGLGLVGRVSVTVVAPDGMTADGLDTTVCVLGPERGLALVEATPGAAALFVRVTEHGVETFASARWKPLPLGPPQGGAEPLHPPASPAPAHAP
jgi:thiamine biosynthesis lipoprotein